VRLSFCWGACGIEEMERKLSAQVLVELQAIGADTWCYPRKDSWRFGCPTLARGKPRATWRMGGPALERGRPEHHLALKSWQKPRLTMATRAPPSAWAAQLRGGDSSATWGMGLGKRPDWL